MAIATITIEDLDLDTGSFKHDFKIEASRIDDGQITASHMIALYVMTKLQTPQFQQDVLEFAQEIVRSNATARITNEHLLSQNDNVVAMSAAG